jgi:hypothetical protein
MDKVDCQKTPGVLVAERKNSIVRPVDFIRLCRLVGFVNEQEVVLEDVDEGLHVES